MRPLTAHLTLLLFTLSLATGRSEENAVSRWWSSSSTHSKSNAPPSPHTQKILSEFAFSQPSPGQPCELTSISPWDHSQSENSQSTSIHTRGTRARPTEQTITLTKRKGFLTLFLKAEGDLEVDELIDSVVTSSVYQVGRGNDRERRRIGYLDISTPLDSLPISSKSSALAIVSRDQEGKGVNSCVVHSEGPLLGGVQAVTSGGEWYFDCTQGLEHAFIEDKAGNKIYIDKEASPVWNTEDKSLNLLFNRSLEEGTPSSKGIKAAFMCNREVKGARLRTSSSSPSSNASRLYKLKVLIEGDLICDQLDRFITFD